MRGAVYPTGGIFWFVKEESDDDLHILFLEIPAEDDFVGNSKNGRTYNHKLTWETVAVSQPKSIRSKSWNDFPRGRVEMRHGKATVYLNPILNEERYQEAIVEAFHLHDTPHRFLSDGSEHYFCAADL